MSKKASSLLLYGLQITKGASFLLRCASVIQSDVVENPPSIEFRIPNGVSERNPQKLEVQINYLARLGQMASARDDECHVLVKDVRGAPQIISSGALFLGRPCIQALYRAGYEFHIL